MNAQEMYEKMAEFILRTGSVSFMELERLIGEKGIGTNEIFFKEKNWVLWAGISSIFADAIELLQKDKRIAPSVAHPLVYMMDGKYLHYPIVKGTRTYKKPHWLPLVFGKRR